MCCYVFLTLTKILVSCTHAIKCGLHANINMHAHSSIWPKCMQLKCKLHANTCMCANAFILLSYTTFILLSYCIHLTLILLSYCTHPTLILHSSYSHTALILLSYCTHPTLVLHSFCMQQHVCACFLHAI